MLHKNVYSLGTERLKKILNDFEQVYLSFSGGKDSGVLLNMYLSLIEQLKPAMRPVIFYLDYEINYKETNSYIDRTFEKLRAKADIYHVCVPFKVNTCTSMFQSYWRPWDEAKKQLWVRQLPERCYTKDDFEFYTEDMWDYDFQFLFGEWLHCKTKAKNTCCLVGIRTQESYNRWRAIHNNQKYDTWCGLKWTSRVFDDIYNAYPIYDWKVEDIWVANGKMQWDYNRLYDLYYQAGVPLWKQRVASPFLCEARESLYLYKVIDPDTWGKMINRVNGVNFTSIYGGTSAMAQKKTELPEGFTWKKYLFFLLRTLPLETRNHYLQKLRTSMDFWRHTGGALQESVIEKLLERNIAIEVVDSPYKTTKKAVRMEYLDEIDIAEHRELPTFKRVCTCILKNDYQCKYMGFAQSKDDRIRKWKVMTDCAKYKRMMYS